MKCAVRYLVLFSCLLGLASICLAQGSVFSRRPHGLVPVQKEEKERARSEDYGHFNGYGRDTKGEVRLLRAEELRQVRDRIGEVTILDWDVKIIQDSTTMWCDLARYRRNIGKLELINNVIVIDPVRRLNADKVTYYVDRKRTVAQGNVRVIRDSTELTSWRGEYEEELDVARVDRDMRIHDLKRDVILTGDQGIYELNRDRGVVPRNPVLIQLDTLGEEKARIVSREMVYNGMQGIAEAREEVVIHWGKDVRGECNRLFYYPDSTKALMLGEPVIWKERDEIRGDSLWIYLEEETLDSAEVFGNAVAYTAADTSAGAPRNRMTGVRIVMDFQDGEVIRMESNDQATAVYHLFEEGEDKGSNRVTGDRIVLHFPEGELKKIEVVGGTEGTYYPRRLAKKIRAKENDGTEDTGTAAR